MRHRHFIYIVYSLVFVTTLTAQKKTAEESQIIAQYQLAYDLNIIDNPVYIRALFRSDFSFSESYFNYVTQQSPTWYLHYFSRNAMQRYGWRNHWELYQERFLVWSDWLQNPFRFQTIFDWNRPRKIFNFLTPALSPLVMYSRSYFIENWAIQHKIDQLKGNDALAEIYGQKYMTVASEARSIQGQPQSIRSLVNSLRNKGVTIETHKREKFVSLGNRVSYYSPTREMALSRVRSKNSPSAKNYNPSAASGGQRIYAPSANQARVRTVIGDVSTTSMGNSGGTNTAAAAREQ